ncbi:hypothetical protein Hypma_000019 [Hypsizygus marmoreus]|uniref:Uncharacterized protein n=1 Tax=Hypsizygus marmoreus TaxID=39966 RepID=A0A369KJD0_HYPMA|nr:hypothetical protein Hypma_000019 [Hypsizygus marmoreus]
MDKALKTQPLAEVRTSKMKDCPILTAGRITPLVLQSWSLACKRYMKHAEKKPEEIVSFVAEAMMEPWLVAWYQAGHTRIDSLTLTQYLEELAKLIELENLNAILTTSSPSHALTIEGLKIQLEANLNSECKLNLLNEPALSANLDAWTIEVKERDDRIKAEDARTQCLIDASNAARVVKRNEKRDLLSRLSDPPRSSRPNANTPTSRGNQLKLPKLTDGERELLDKYDGCTRCRKFHAGHRAKECWMVAKNSWPDAETYVPLTLEVALASKPQVSIPSSRLPAAAVISTPVEYCDDETDSYVDPSPLTIPHLVATLDAFGPNISEFPLSISALVDNGCPSTVISTALADQLGLRRYPLPPAEDNLSSLSESPLPCKEYVKMEVSSGNGGWRSDVFRAKVIVGLPLPLILGMPFLSSHQIVIDPNLRTATDKRTGFDLLNPTIPSRVWAPERIIPPPTPPKTPITTAVSLESASEPALAGYLLPKPIMAAK